MCGPGPELARGLLVACCSCGRAGYGVNGRHEGRLQISGCHIYEYISIMGMLTIAASVGPKSIASLLPRVCDASNPRQAASGPKGVRIPCNTG